MIAWDETTVIGGSYIVFALLGILIDSVVIVGIFKSGLLEKRQNPLYILASYAIFDVIIRLVVTAGYWGPTVLFQSPIYDNELYGTFSFHCTQIMFAVWGEGSVTQVLIAVDRFLTMKAVMVDNVVNRESNVFTRRNCLIYVCSVFPTLVVVQYLTVYLLPCCRY